MPPGATGPAPGAPNPNARLAPQGQPGTTPSGAPNLPGGAGAPKAPGAVPAPPAVQPRAGGSVQAPEAKPVVPEAARRPNTPPPPPPPPPKSVAAPPRPVPQAAPQPQPKFSGLSHLARLPPHRRARLHRMARLRHRHHPEWPRHLACGPTATAVRHPRLPIRRHRHRHRHRDRLRRRRGRLRRLRPKNARRIFLDAEKGAGQTSVRGLTGYCFRRDGCGCVVEVLTLQAGRLG